jgi:hypothetical protein
VTLTHRPVLCKSEVLIQTDWSYFLLGGGGQRGKQSELTVTFNPNVKH